jgi:hypothetical protein
MHAWAELLGSWWRFCAIPSGCQGTGQANPYPPVVGVALDNAAERWERAFGAFMVMG